MNIKEIRGREILDSRKEATIQAIIKTDFGLFVASSPSGKSRGRYEDLPYVRNIEDDIETLNNIKVGFEINNFLDLEKIEEVLKGKIGANTLFALESATLKALAAENNVEVWQLLNPKARKFPIPVGNCVGGGKHSRGRKPDFQEFLALPITEKFVDAVFLMRKIYENVGKSLELKKAKFGFSDENAWMTNLNDKEVLEILKTEVRNLEMETDKKIEIGVDIAASSFYTGLIYNYKNPSMKLNNQKQLDYLTELINKFDIFYVEDPFHEDGFEYFARLRENTITSLIVGDDLTVSNIKRFVKAVRSGSVNAIIVKPNQNGSLLEIKKLIDLARAMEVKTIISHRSGETMDNIIADLAFAWQTDFIKTGIVGKEREVKLNKLIQIENKLTF